MVGGGAGSRGQVLAGATSLNFAIGVRFVDCVSVTPAGGGGGHSRHTYGVHTASHGAAGKHPDSSHLYFLQEMSFVASDMALEIIGDIAIVWFLSPQLRLGRLPSSGFAKWTAALPGSSAQVGGASSVRLGPHSLSSTMTATLT